ncbi:MAG: hypothetical protein EU536_01425 [Promethearchaeota archaeon]|nr:MAG: hypothetical protein EU536_01425 [Candidatus Lokiarchaeota archaeon]
MGEVKESKEFIDVLDYGLTLLSEDHLELKREIISLLIKKTRTLEKLMELGTKHAVQSSLYDLEQEGFITRHVKENVYSYEFNRKKILFKIRKDLEMNYGDLQAQKKFHTLNDCLFTCNSCHKLYDYAKAMENGFLCCNNRVTSFDSSAIMQEIDEKMSFIAQKLNSLTKC